MHASHLPAHCPRHGAHRAACSGPLRPAHPFVPPHRALPSRRPQESLLRGVSRSVAAKAPACLVCGTAGRELAAVGGIHLIAASSRARTLPTDDESMASTLTARLLPFVPAGGAVDAAVLATAAPLLPPELSHKAQCIPVYGPGEPQRLANIAGSGSSGEEAEDVVYRTMIAEATRACATEGEAPWQLCAVRGRPASCVGFYRLTHHRPSFSCGCLWRGLRPASPRHLQ